MTISCLLAARWPIIAGLACAALAACVPAAPEPTPAPTPAATAATRPQVQAPVLAAPAQFAHWHDAPATPGNWLYRPAGTDKIAEFLSPAGGQLFQLICTQDRDIMLSVIAHAPNARAITIRTEYFDRALPADAMENSVGTMLSPADPLLDAMAFSKGRFAVEVAGGPQLFLPAWPEVVRVIEQCRG